MGTDLPMPTPDEPPIPLLPPFLGVVFDLDGTLVLSGHDFRRMRREVIRVAERYGVPPGELSVEMPIHLLLERSRGEIDSLAMHGLRERFEAEFQSILDRIEWEALPQVRPRPGALELVRGLATRGYRIGVLTRSSEPFAVAALERTGLFPYVRRLRGRTPVGPVKPDPEALRRLLEDLGVPVSRSVSIGDHLLDGECAHGLGVPFFAVLPDPGEPSTGMTRERFRGAGAVEVFSDLLALRRRLLPDTGEPLAIPGSLA